MASFEEMLGKSLGAMSSGSGMSPVQNISRPQTLFRGMSLLKAASMLKINNVRLKHSEVPISEQIQDIYNGLAQASPGMVMPDNMISFTSYISDIKHDDIISAVNFMKNAVLGKGNPWRMLKEHGDFVVSYLYTVYAWGRDTDDMDSVENIERFVMCFGRYNMLYWNAVMHMYYGTFSEFTARVTGSNIAETSKSIQKEIVTLRGLLRTAKHGFDKTQFECIDGFLNSISTSSLILFDKYNDTRECVNNPYLYSFSNLLSTYLYEGIKEAILFLDTFQ